jgi:hypothetical protein
MGTGELDFLPEEFEELKDMIKGIELELSEEYGDNESEEDEEYSESFEEDLKEYQERFRRYAENLKKEIRNLYEPKENKSLDHRYNERGTEREEMKTPWERGHKLECGCPGCSAYREFHGIELVNNKDSDFKLPDLGSVLRKNERREEYKESSSRPCGGKHYHFFHGERSEFRRLFGNYSRKLNLNLAGY